MKKEFLVDVSQLETRVATLEDDHLVELMIEPAGSRQIVGNIYKGIVSEVIPGLQAAFIDIGSQRNAFLHASDLVTDVHDIGAFLDDDYDNLQDRRGGRGRKRDVPPIEKQLNKGQDILVQITKEPIGKKGPRATANITLAGRFLVLMPYADHVGVSRKISSRSERDRLRKLVKSLRSGDSGFIIRTVGQGASKREIRQEMSYLTRLSRDIVRRAKKSPAPSLAYDDLGMVFSIIRDVLTEEVESLIINEKSLYKRVKEFARRVAPSLHTRIEYYQGRYPLFEAYDIEQDVERISHRRVWLPNGGHLVIEQTEALISVDVNTGKFVGKKNLENTVYQTNIEAATEIARQLRLRDLGGIIIIDFIDMEVHRHRDNVVKELKKALAPDRSKTRVRKISDLGLVEMTRKRVRKSLTKRMTTRCPCCEGSGLVLAETPFLNKVESLLRKELCSAGDERIQLICNPHSLQIIQNSQQTLLNDLAEEFNREIILQTEQLLPFDDIKIKKISRQSEGKKRPKRRRRRR